MTQRIGHITYHTCLSKPAHPKTGDIWFDVNTCQLYCFEGDRWASERGIALSMRVADYEHYLGQWRVRIALTVVSVVVSFVLANIIVLIKW